MQPAFRQVTLCFLLAFALSSEANAQSTDEEDLALVYGDKSTISIATGSKQNFRRAPAVASVVTSEEIEAMGAKDLDAILESVPGIHVSRASIRYPSTYTIRGIGGGGPFNPQILLLQNGIPTTTMYSGDKGYAWVGVPVENIARIEIIRGPGSALYGADAYAGVINVITKTASDTLGTSIGARLGSFNTKSTWLQHGGVWGDMDVATYLRVGTTDGIKEIIQADNATRFGTSLAPGAVSTGYNSIDGSINISYEKWRVRSAYKLRDKLGTGAGVASALDPNSLGQAESINADISWKDPLFTQNWGLAITASTQHYASTQPNNLQLYPPGTILNGKLFSKGLIGGPNSWDKQFRLSGSASYSGFSNHNLRIGAGYNYLDLYRVKTVNNFTLDSKGAPIPISIGTIDITEIQPHIRPHLRRLNYLYAQDEWNFTRDWTLTTGVRQDNYSDFGSTTNPRLALVWDTAINLTSKFLYGQAFRAPSFSEQYNLNPVANGNAELSPETIQTMEAAFSWQACSNTLINLNLFHFNTQNIITLVNNTAPALGATYQNIGSQQGSGIELEAIWDANSALRLTGNYAYQKSIDSSSKQDVGYAPHSQLYLRTDWRYTNGWHASTQVNRVMDRMRSAGDTRPQVPNYTTVDLSVGTPRKSSWQITASVLNLFNADVREPSSAPSTAIPNDLPMAPRSLWLQSNYKM